MQAALADWTSSEAISARMCTPSDVRVVQGGGQASLAVEARQGAPIAYPWAPTEDQLTLNLAAATRLGPYEIVAPVGAGGMGEVYRARDTRLDREVAVKILPATLAADPQFRARFEREAKTISSLNHPHVCTLHDVGQGSVEGTEVHYLVLELIEGEPLADRLLKGPLSVEQVLRAGWPG